MLKQSAGYFLKAGCMEKNFLACLPFNMEKRQRKQHAWKLISYSSNNNRDFFVISNTKVLALHFPSSGKGLDILMWIFVQYTVYNTLIFVMLCKDWYLQATEESQ